MPTGIASEPGGLCDTSQLYHLFRDGGCQESIRFFHVPFSALVRSRAAAYDRHASGDSSPIFESAQESPQGAPEALVADGVRFSCEAVVVMLQAATCFVVDDIHTSRAPKDDFDVTRAVFGYDHSRIWADTTDILNDGRGGGDSGVFTHTVTFEFSVEGGAHDVVGESGFDGVVFERYVVTGFDIDRSQQDDMKSIGSKLVGGKIDNHVQCGRRHGDIEFLCRDDEAFVDDTGGVAACLRDVQLAGDLSGSNDTIVVFHNSRRAAGADGDVAAVGAWLGLCRAHFGVFVGEVL